MQVPSSEFEELRRTAAELINQALLPNGIPANMWGGYGTGKVCSLCNKEIDIRQVEYEVGSGESPAGSTFRFHIWCHTAWQSEVAERSASSVPATANPTRPQGRAAFFGEAAMFTAQLVGPTDEPPGVNAASARRGRDTATWKRVCDERCTCAGHAAGVCQS